MLDILERVEELLAQAARLRQDIDAARLRELTPDHVERERRQSERRRGERRRA